MTNVVEAGQQWSVHVWVEGWRKGPEHRKPHLVLETRKGAAAGGIGTLVGAGGGLFGGRRRRRGRCRVGVHGRHVVVGVGVEGYRGVDGRVVVDEERERDGGPVVVEIGAEAGGGHERGVVEGRRAVVYVDGHEHRGRADGKEKNCWEGQGDGDGPMWGGERDSAGVIGPLGDSRETVWE
jgi:hypothetical protein